MKRLLCLCLPLLLILSLAACGKKADEQDTTPGADTEKSMVSEPTPEPEPEPPIPFTDVPEDAPYYDSVVWAYESGIVSDGSAFESDSHCTRAQVVTFLWRTMKSPEPQTVENPFTDISSSNWYYQAALWAYENSIVTGTTFNPDNTCTNAETLTFLWRAVGKPAAAVYSSPIALADSDSYYARPVAWAENNGMFAGMDSAFDPTAPCCRSDIVEYLYWVTEQWIFTEEDRDVQAEYEKIVSSTRPSEIRGSGLLYADYVDVDGDGSAELLTMDLNFSEFEFTATVYTSINGHAEKSCEETFEAGAIGGRLADFCLCKADGHLYLKFDGHGITADSYQFYKIEKTAITLENDLIGDGIEYTEEDDVRYNGHSDFGKEITEDEFNAIMQKYTDQKVIFYRSYSDFDVSHRGIVLTPSEYWEANRDQIYAAVVEGDFSYFAGEYYEGGEFWHGSKTSTELSRTGALTYSLFDQTRTTGEPVSITVTESGSIYCVIKPEVSYEDGTVYGEYFVIYPYGVKYNMDEVKYFYPYGVEGDTDKLEYFDEEYGLDEIRIIYTSLDGFSGDSFQYQKVQ